MQHVAPVDAARCNTSSRLKPATAARELGINRSSLKRYFDQYPELLDDAGLVDLAALQQHRADNPRITDPTSGEKVRAPKSEGGGQRKGTKARIEEIKLLEAERDWALSIGKLVDPEEMLDAITETVTSLRDKLMAPDHSLCERIAEERDPRAIQTLLREENRKLVEEVIGTLRKLVTPVQADAPG